MQQAVCYSVFYYRRKGILRASPRQDYIVPPEMNRALLKNHSRYEKRKCIPFGFKQTDRKNKTKRTFDWIVIPFESSGVHVYLPICLNWVKKYIKIVDFPQSPISLILTFDLPLSVELTFKTPTARQGKRSLASGISFLPPVYIKFLNFRFIVTVEWMIMYKCFAFIKLHLRVKNVHDSVE